MRVPSVGVGVWAHSLGKIVHAVCDVSCGAVLKDIQGESSGPHESTLEAFVVACGRVVEPRYLFVGINAVGHRVWVSPRGKR